MDSQNNDLLIELILDIKKDVTDLKTMQIEDHEISIKNSVILDEHARRSTASERRLDLQEEKFDEFVKKMQPIEDHVKSVKSVTKFMNVALKVLGTIVTIVGGIMAWLKHLK